jgi:hypothetical protein
MFGVKIPHLPWEGVLTEFTYLAFIFGVERSLAVGIAICESHVNNTNRRRPLEMTLMLLAEIDFSYLLLSVRTLSLIVSTWFYHPLRLHAYCSSTDLEIRIQVRW